MCHHSILSRIGASNIPGAIQSLPIPPTPENPKVLQPTPPPTAAFDGTGFASIGIGWPAQRYSMKFAKTGAYPFICILHVDQGMTGIVNVTATAVAPARTGTGGIADATGGASRTSETLLALAMIGLVAGARRATSRMR